MAFSEEQESQILETIGKMNEFFSKKEEPKDDKSEEEKDLLKEAKKNLETKSNQDEEQSKMEKALRFDLSISKFAEDFKDVLPSSIKSIIETANGKTYGSAVAKADEIRKAIIDAFVEVQANVDGLPETMKQKARDYKALTEDAKKSKSGSFWEIVEVGAEMQKAKNRANAISKANGSGNGGEENAFRQKFLSLGDKWKRKE